MNDSNCSTKPIGTQEYTNIIFLLISANKEKFQRTINFALDRPFTLGGDTYEKIDGKWTNGKGTGVSDFQMSNWLSGNNFISQDDLLIVLDYVGKEPK